MEQWWYCVLWEECRVSHTLLTDRWSATTSLASLSSISLTAWALITSVSLARWSKLDSNVIFYVLCVYVTKLLNSSLFGVSVTLLLNVGVTAACKVYANCYLLWCVCGLSKLILNVWCVCIAGQSWCWMQLLCKYQWDLSPITKALWIWLRRKRINL